MRVMILSITAGEGHNSTAKSIRNELMARGAECEILDTYKTISTSFQKTFNSSYLFLSNRTSSLYYNTYKKLEHRKPNSSSIAPSELTSRYMAHHLNKYVADYDPDVVIATHVFSAQYLAMMKERGKTQAKTIAVVTDFAFHPYWEECTTLDRIVLPNERMIPQGLSKGFTREQMVPSGIPIQTKFASSRSPLEARTTLGLDPDTPLLLVMGGSMGHGKLVENVEQLDNIEADFQIAVVCGYNKTAKGELDALKTKKKLTVFGFTDQIDLLMDAADCLITKPGGLTTSESLAKRLPMIMVNPIPGQETRNVDFLLNAGTALSVTDIFPLKDAVHQYFSEPTRMELMRQCTDLIRKPDSTQAICQLVFDLAAQAEAERTNP